jgi:uncharacterized protein (TIGR03435 family)
MLVCAGTGLAQKSPAVDGADALGPAFEVAAVRPSSSEGRHWVGTKLDPSGRFEASQVSVKFLFWVAYGNAPGKSNVVTDHDAPKWVESEQFDVNAKVDEAYMRGWDKLSDGQRMEVVRPMLRRLLADRFHLKMRVEMRKTPVYALVQAKGGAHMKEVAAPAPVVGDQTEAWERWVRDHPEEAYPGNITCSEKCVAHAVKMSNAVGQIQGSSQADRMVIDETGLTGYYDFSFRIGVPSDGDETAMQAVEDDLGVKFEPRSVAMKTYVIVSAEKPSVDGA